MARDLHEHVCVVTAAAVGTRRLPGSTGFRAAGPTPAGGIVMIEAATCAMRVAERSFSGGQGHDGTAETGRLTWRLRPSTTVHAFTVERGRWLRGDDDENRDE